MTPRGRRAAALALASVLLSSACTAGSGPRETTAPSDDEMAAPAAGTPAVTATVPVPRRTPSGPIVDLSGIPPVSDPSSAIDQIKEVLSSGLPSNSPEASLVNRPDLARDHFFLALDAAFADAAGLLERLPRGGGAPRPRSEWGLGGARAASPYQPGYGPRQVLLDRTFHEDPTTVGLSTGSGDGTMSLYLDGGTIYAHDTLSANSTTTTADYSGTGTDAMTMDGSVGVCPDEAGSVRGQLSTSWKSTYTVTKPTAKKLEVDLRAQADLFGRNGDDAHLIGYDLLNADFRGTFQNFSANTTTGYTWQGSEIGVKPRSDLPEPGSVEGDLRTHDVNDAARALVAQLTFAHMLASKMFQAAEELWRKGYCVQVVLQADTKKALNPGDLAPIQVEVRHRKDDSLLHLRVTADAADSGTVSPEDAQSSATMTLVAGAKPPAGYRVIVESISKRGMDQAGVAWGLDLVPYDIVETETRVCTSTEGWSGSDGWTITGHVDPDTSEPGMITGSGTYSGRMLLPDELGHMVPKVVSGTALIWGEVSEGKLTFLGDLYEHFLTPFGGDVPVKGGHGGGTTHGDLFALKSNVQCDRTWDWTVTPTQTK